MRFMEAQASVCLVLLKVSIPTKFDAKRLTFEYVMICLLFYRICCLGEILGVLYLSHFQTNLDVLRCIGKVLSMPFRLYRCANVKVSHSFVLVSVFIYVERLIPLSQIHFASVQPSVSVDIWTVHTSTKFGEHRCTFDLFMNYFLFTDPQIPLCSTYFLEYMQNFT